MSLWGSCWVAFKFEWAQSRATKLMTEKSLLWKRMNTLEPGGGIFAADECGYASPDRTWNVVDSVFLYKQGLYG